MRKALFVDLDHTLIRPKSGELFPQSTDDWEFIPGVLTRLYYWHARNVLEPQAIVIITNQGGVLAGYQTVDEVEGRIDAVVEQLKAHLAPAGDAEVRAYIAYANDFYRKPLPGLAFRAAIELELDLPNSWMVGDMESDYEFSRNAGLKGFSWAESYFNWNQHPFSNPLNVREG